MELRKKALLIISKGGEPSSKQMKSKACPTCGKMSEHEHEREEAEMPSMSKLVSKSGKVDEESLEEVANYMRKKLNIKAG